MLGHLTLALLLWLGVVFILFEIIKDSFGD